MPKNSPLLVDIGQGFSIMTGVPTIAYWDTENRPQNARKGTFGFNFETNNLEYWDGDVWFVASMSENQL